MRQVGLLCLGTFLASIVFSVATAGRMNSITPIQWAGAMVGLLFWTASRVVLRPREFRHAHLVGSSARAVWAHSLVAAARIGLGYVTVLGLATALGSFLGAVAGSEDQAIHIVDLSLGHPPQFLPGLPWAFIEVSAQAGAVWLLLLLSVLAGMLCVLFALGERLEAATMKEALAADNRPYFLLLRSFDEDRAWVPSRVLVSGLLPRWLVPAPRRSLEEVLVHGLTKVGPVVAIAQPGTRLPALGAAKASLLDSEWRDRVAELVRDARAVVVMATPGRVSKEGFAWELDLLLRQGADRKLMLVFGPWKEAEGAERWSRFKGAACPSNIMGDLCLLPAPSGARVAARSGPEGGWRLFGSAETSDAAYLASIHEALSTVHRQPRPTPGQSGQPARGPNSP
jgi:hypothetical protein